MNTLRTTCPYCGVGCGLTAGRDAQGRVALAGDTEHPANFGRLCSKGAALGETLGLAGRLLHPEVAGARTDWNTALDAVAEGLRRTVAEHGPDAVAFYVSGQLLTEDYYVANKLMKGFIGSANIDTNSRLCMSSSVVGHKRAFGSDTVPGSYEDLEQADLVVLVGSNLAWCHPVLYQRVLAARRARAGRPALVVIDPRRTASCDEAELHLPLAPGSDTALFDGLLAYLHQHDRLDPDFLEAHTEGYWAALKAARSHAGSIPAVARRCGLDEEAVADFYARFARTDKVVTVYSQGVNQSAHGSDKVNAILNCHLASGRIGRPGAGPFSVTGQPNAMGGREVGGLANQLAAHMDFEPGHVERVQRFWNAPNIARTPGLKAVDLFRALADGKVKAIWIAGTNPAVSLAEAEAVHAALAACPLVIVSDAVADTDTVRLAHIRLPALTWGEKDGTVSNSERCISRQRAFLPPPGEARADWWIFAEVGHRLGFDAAFPYRTPAEVFREHAALSGFENTAYGSVTEGAPRDFDISALAELADAEYETLAPLRWPQPRAGAPIERFFAAGGFFTPSGRGRLIAIGARAPARTPDAEHPLVLNTGRVRDHWHTLTRTGQSPRLSAHAPEPFAELHPDDARAFGIVDETLVRVVSRHGEAVVRAKLAAGQRRGSVFVPMHWGAPQASLGRVNAAVEAAVDPLSGQPESKHTPVRVEPWRPAWQGFVLSREPLTLPGTVEYRVVARGDGFWRHELAGTAAEADWGDWAFALLGAAEAEWIEYADPAAGVFRAACLREGRLEACVFVATRAVLPSRAWLGGLFSQPEVSGAERAGLLAGRPTRGQADTGRIVCACFGVGVNTLLDVIRGRGLITVEAVGAALKAGTGCGSCVSEIRALIGERAA